VDLDQFLAGSGLKGLRRSHAGYLAVCPAHADHAPSLSISAGDDGRVLLHCWAGCETRDIVAALGLQWTDLFPARAGRRRWR